MNDAGPYRAYALDHDVPSYLSAHQFYKGKAANYMRLALAAEQRAKRAGRGSTQFTRWMRLLTTFSTYLDLAKENQS